MGFKPDEKLKTAYDVDYEALYEKGYRAVMFDIDNTLVPEDAPADDRAKDFFSYLRELGFKTMLLSNNRSEDRVREFAEAVGADFCQDNSMKPLKSGYEKGMKLLGTTADTTVFVGDQIFTDMLGALNAGLYTILTSPLDKSTDGAGIKFRRVFEKPIRGIYNRMNQ